jgi:Rps23 Pro-64 3,4-dihydroxylase Tpa1-like proline 4-hydroxylase
VRHTDRSDSCPGRTLTAILYLNPNWEPVHWGGELCLYPASPRWPHAAPWQGVMSARQGYRRGEPALMVAPLENRLVVFESGIAHEVLPVGAVRCSHECL